MFFALNSMLLNLSTVLQVRLDETEVRCEWRASFYTWLFSVMCTTGCGQYLSYYVKVASCTTVLPVLNNFRCVKSKQELTTTNCWVWESGLVIYETGITPVRSLSFTKHIRIGVSDISCFSIQEAIFPSLSSHFSSSVSLFCFSSILRCAQDYLGRDERWYYWI